MATELISDGTGDFIGGQDASKFPSRIPMESYHAGINISVQDGVPVPRWAWDKKKLLFGSETFDVGNNILIHYSEIFRSGRFQMRARYTIGNDEYILIVIAGIMYLINIDTFAVTILSLPNGDTLNENAPRLNWSNADKYFVIFDYPNFPVILDGISAKRADPSKYEVPVAVLGAYNQNRLFIANAASQYTAGDPTGSLATPRAPVTFEEVLTPSTPFYGQIFDLPTNVLKAQITAMGFLEFSDTSTGIGPLIIGTRDQIFSVQSQLARADWETTKQFCTALVSTGGIAGPRCILNVNGDMFYLGTDAQLRTLSMSRNEQGKWARTPISREVSNWLIVNDPTLVEFSFLGYFKNKVFVSANPHRVAAFSRNRDPIYDIAFGGFAVLELDNLATLGKDTPPVWAGLWTGVRPLDMLTIGERCFVISKDEESVNQIYEVNPNTTYDTDDDGAVRYSDSYLYTREYDFKSSFANKGLHSLDLGLRNVQGDFKITVEYKPSHGNKFVLWDSFEHEAPWRSCDIPTDCAVNGLDGHSFRDLTIGNTQGSPYDPVSDLVYSEFRKLQLRFRIEGKYWELHEYMLKAVPLPQGQQITTSDVYNPVELCHQCNPDWKIGAFKSCSIPQT